MSRLLRSRQPPGFYYVVMLSSGGELLFRDEHDRAILEQFCAKAFGTGRWTARAFRCTDHDARLLVEIRRRQLGDLMRKISVPYARRYNVRHDRTGSLFGERYRVTPVLKTDVARVARHLQAETESDVRRPWLTPVTWSDVDDLPQSFPLEKGDGRFARWLASRVSVQLRAEKENLKAPRGSFDDVVAAVCRMVGVEVARVYSPARVRRLALARALIAWYVMQNEIATLSVAAERLDRDPSSLFVAYERYKKTLPRLFGLKLEQLLRVEPHRRGPLRVHLRPAHPTHKEVSHAQDT